MGYARLQTEPFHVERILSELTTDEVGGVTLYVGTVRGRDGTRTIRSLEYEAFSEMAQAQLDSLRKEAIQRFGLVDATVVHRTGRLEARTPILVVALAGRHRAETYDAVRFFMDRLKEIVPIWKQEEGSEGRAWILGAHGTRVRP